MAVRIKLPFSNVHELAQTSGFAVCKRMVAAAARAATAEQSALESWRTWPDGKVRQAPRTSRLTAFMTWCAVNESSPDVGSSRNRTLGLRAGVSRRQDSSAEVAALG